MTSLYVRSPHPSSFTRRTLPFWVLSDWHRLTPIVGLYCLIVCGWQDWSRVWYLWFVTAPLLWLSRISKHWLVGWKGNWLKLPQFTLRFGCVYRLLWAKRSYLSARSNIVEFYKLFKVIKGSIILGIENRLDEVLHECLPLIFLRQLAARLATKLRR